MLYLFFYVLIMGHQIDRVEKYTIWVEEPTSIEVNYMRAIYLFSKKENIGYFYDPEIGNYFPVTFEKAGDTIIVQHYRYSNVDDCRIKTLKAFLHKNGEFLKRIKMVDHLGNEEKLNGFFKNNESFSLPDPG